MNLFISPNGIITCLYSEQIPLAKIGRLKIKRFSNVEFNTKSGKWEVLKSGRAIYRNVLRGNCLKWEVNYFNKLQLTSMNKRMMPPTKNL
jgi:hypothetical protein